MSQFHFPFLHQLHHLKRSLLALLYSLLTPFLSLLLLFLLFYNASLSFSPFVSLSHPTPCTITNLSFSHHHNNSSSGLLMHPNHSNLLSLQQENSPPFPNTHFSLIHNSSIHRLKHVKNHKHGLTNMHSESQFSPFKARINAFFAGNNSSYCKVRFFMTWISPLESFGRREVLTLESMFKSHQRACLVIVSKSLDSDRGNQILRPFLNNGFKVMTIAPDFNYLFKDTHAESWFDRLKRGKVKRGGVSLGQNLSNLLRLVLLYKFGGIYIDTDVIVLKSFSKVRNTIGAQNIDVKSGRWSRLNNAVLIFDKTHPLLLKFIEEFALTFDGNKWGHNGPYLVSRVLSRESGRSGFDNVTVMPPSAFYPVDWRGIRSLFEKPRDEKHSKWLVKKLGEIREESLALHLWNRQSRKLEVEKGSIVDGIISSCCIFCNSWN